MAVKIRLKGHGSFYIREGWLTKGIKAIENDPYAFVNKNPTDEFGIGANMVSALRYWLQAVGLTEEKRGKKRYQELTEDFGRIITKYDLYLEETFSLWLLHYKLATNINNATSWYLFFNKFEISEFTRSDLIKGLSNSLLNLEPGINYSERSLEDDCNCILKTYNLNTGDLDNPEDNLICPFTSLKLIKSTTNLDFEKVYVKNSPTMRQLDKMVVLYVIIDNLKLNKEEDTTIESLLLDDCNIGKVFNLDKNTINSYLDVLEKEGYVKVNRTAGLNTIYPSSMCTEDILEEYYTSKIKGEV